MKNAKGSVILLGLAAVLGIACFTQHRAIARARAEQEDLKSRSAELHRLKIENARCKSNPVRDENELKQRIESGAVLRFRIDALKEVQARIAALKMPDQPGPIDYTGLWRNSGRSTPANALHSIIWASLNGDVDVLTTMLAFDPESREAADALRAWLPETVRAQYPTSDKLLATLIAGRLSPALYQAEWKDQIEEQPDLMRARFVLQSANPMGRTIKDVYLRFQRNGSDWRLVVPKSVVTEFQRALQSK